MVVPLDIDGSSYLNWLYLEKQSLVRKSIMADTKTDLVGLLTSFAIFSSLAIAVVTAFSILLRPNNRVVYEPRSKFCNPE
jgi:hypothetical protein